MTLTNEKPDPLIARGIKLQGEYFADYNLLVDIIAKDTEAHEELKQERDALVAQVERLQLAILNAIPFVPGGSVKADLRDAYDETPPVALSALKAQWQAEAVDRCEKEVTASVNVLLKPHIAGVFSVIRQQLQEKF